MDFLRVCYSAPVVEGYGQTECSAASTVTLMEDVNAKSKVGVPLVCNEIKLVDVPDMNYTAKDIVDGVPCPRGEICFRGSNVFQGYYKMPEQTAEALEGEWLHSGDIGMWLPDGQLKIIDRKKNIFKLAQGEYVAPEKLENIYHRNPFVAQIFIHGDSLESHVVAVIVPDEEAVKAWAAKENIKWEGLAKMVQRPELKATIKKELDQTAKTAKLQKFEMVREFHLTAEPFTQENDLLTPTFKLKRPQAHKKYKKEIDALYEIIHQEHEAHVHVPGQPHVQHIQSKL